MLLDIVTVVKFFKHCIYCVIFPFLDCQIYFLIQPLVLMSLDIYVWEMLFFHLQGPQLTTLYFRYMLVNAVRS